MHLQLHRKVGGQINALNRLKKMLPFNTKYLLYRSFTLPYFYYSSPVWRHCGKRKKMKELYVIYRETGAAGG